MSSSLKNSSSSCIDIPKCSDGNLLISLFANGLILLPLITTFKYLGNLLRIEATCQGTSRFSGYWALYCWLVRDAAILRIKLDISVSSVYFERFGWLGHLLLRGVAKISPVFHSLRYRGSKNRKRYKLNWLLWWWSWSGL